MKENRKKKRNRNVFPIILAGAVSVANILPGMSMEAFAAPEDITRVLLNETFEDASAGTFGFSTGAAVEGGALKLTTGMKTDYKNSVKTFAPEIASRKSIDLTFKWSADIQKAKGKTGIEFRDSYGRLLFALCGAYSNGSQWRYAVAGTALDSSKSSEKVMPEYKAEAYTNKEVYTVHLSADFAAGTLNFDIKDENGNVKASGENISTEARSLSQMLACNYFTENGTCPVIHSIDDFVLRGEENDSELAGCTLYAFGDSIVNGHQYNKFSFPNFTAEKEGMKFSNQNKFAVNGAYVKKNDSNWIMNQVQKAPEEAPDYIIFDGGINDAEEMKKGNTELGEISEGKELSQLDNTKFAGAFEELIGTMQQKWPTAKIVYVAVHKTNTRDGQIQESLYQMEKKICEKWGVTVADIYSQDGLDSLNNSENVKKYAFDSVDGTTGLPKSDSKSATHPNFSAIEEFYVPIVSEALHRAASVQNPPAQGADKTELQAEIAKAENLHQEEYTPKSWETFQAKLEAARETAAKEDAVQGEVDGVLAELKEAQEALEKAEKPKPADKTELQAAIAKAEALKEADYTAASWKSLQTKLQAAKEINNNANATSQEITKALTRLEAAMNALSKIDGSEGNKPGGSEGNEPGGSGGNEPGGSGENKPGGSGGNEPGGSGENKPGGSGGNEPGGSGENKPGGSDNKDNTDHTGETPVPEKKVSGIQLAANSYRIAAGKKVDLGKKAKVLPKDAKNKKVTWESSNSKYASVNGRGVVTAKKAGAGKKVTITVKAQDGSKVTAKVTVQVMKHAVKKVSLKVKNNTVKAGKKVKITAKVKTNGKKANTKLAWKSSNKKYAAVNSKGIVTAKKAGKGKTVTITAVSTDGTNKKGTVKIRIR